MWWTEGGMRRQREVFTGGLVSLQRRDLSCLAKPIAALLPGPLHGCLGAEIPLTASAPNLLLLARLLIASNDGCETHPVTYTADTFCRLSESRGEWTGDVTEYTSSSTECSHTSAVQWQ